MENRVIVNGANASDASSGSSFSSTRNRDVTIDETNVITSLQLFSRGIVGDNIITEPPSSIAVPSTLGVSRGVIGDNPTTEPPSSTAISFAIDDNSTSSLANVTIEKEASSTVHGLTPILLDNNISTTRLQDVSTSDLDMQRNKNFKSYRRMQIPKYGPKNHYYLGLSSIAIDYIIAFKKDAQYWTRKPKNTTVVKMIIIELLIASRKIRPESKYELDQIQFLYLLKNQWGGERPAAVMEDNDRIRLFGLLLSRESNHHIAERLAGGIKDKARLDDPSCSPHACYQLLAMEFNDERIKVDLHHHAIDIEGYEHLDPKDRNGIKMYRDCVLILFYMMNSKNIC